MDVKEVTKLMFNQMRDCAKSPTTTDVKIKSDSASINQTIDLMEQQVLNSVESLGKTNGRRE